VSGGAADAGEERRARVDAAFLSLVELAPEARPRALEELCPEPDLRREVEALLASDARAPSDFLAGDERRAPELACGSRVGPYRILERLGEGGMGTVWAARQAFPRRDVALKVLRAGRSSEAAVRRFRHEIDVLGRLQHPGIARIYDAGVVEARDDRGGAREVPYFTMELVRGVPLVRYAREQALGRPERIELLARVCDAVHYAHQRAVIHRDLKPENVPVTTEESTASGDAGLATARVIGCPKVLDFGIARVVDPELPRSTRHTVDGALVGTLTAMSPEQAAGERRLVDVRADVYALGAMLYELVCGRPPLPVDGLTVPQALRRIAERAPTPPGELDPALRGDLTTIALKALAKDPERRYQTAGDLASDLRAHLRGEPVLARADSRLYLLRRSLRRHRVAFGVASGFALLLGTFAAISVRQARESAELAASEARARGLAESDFERSLAAVELLTELGAGRLVGIPLADAARRELLEAALDHHRELVRAHPDLGELAGRRAVARLRVAELERDLGHRARALGEARAAVGEFEELARSAAGGEVAALGLVSSLTLCGSLLSEDGELAEAQRLLARAAAVAEATVTDPPEGGGPTPDALARFASAHKHLAICLRSRGRLDDALATLEAATPALEHALADAPSTQLASELIALLQQASVLRVETGSLDGVEELLGRAIELAAELVRAEPGSPRHLEDLAALHSNRSVALTQAGRPREALAELDVAIELGERLVADHPALEQPRESLVTAYHNRASLRVSADDLAGAERDAARATELFAAVLPRAPSADRLGTLANLENLRAAVQIQLGRPADGIATLRRCIEHADAALARLPGRLDLRALERYARCNLALCHADLGDHAAAATVLDRVRFPGDGYSGLQELAAVLRVWQDAARAARADASLASEQRRRLVEGYLERATAYLTDALAAGFGDLAGLRAAGEGSLLREHAAFERAVGPAAPGSERRRAR